MTQMIDCMGQRVRLTDERRAHILEHPEMRDLGAQVESTLRLPQEVRRSRTDSAVSLYYRYYARTLVGGKWLCVVVKYAPGDAFVVTAYLTDKPKAGELLWPTE